MKGSVIDPTESRSIEGEGYMKKISAFLSKAIGFIYVFFLYHSRKNAKVSNGKILIIVSGHLGNLLMDVHALYDLKNYYLSKNKQVYILTSSNIWKLMNRCFDFSDAIFATDQFPYDKKKILHLNQYRKMLKSLPDSAYEVIVANLTSGYTADFLMASLKANEKWGVFPDSGRSDWRTYFRRAYTNKIMVDKDLHETQQLKLLLKQIGGIDHVVRITPIPPKEDIRFDGKYITLALDSMSKERRWPVENFVSFAEYVLAHSDYDVYLTGTKLDKKDDEKLTALRANARVKDYIGKTTMDEWIEMLRGSRFHLSVDSGSIHFAASVGTPCVCLSGVWDGTRCMPYVLDAENEGTCNPVCVYREDHLKATAGCYGCRMSHGFYGVGNDACMKDIKAGQPCHCLSKISADRAAAAFESIMR